MPPLVGSQIPSGATVRRPPPAPGTRRADLIPSRPARSRGNALGPRALSLALVARGNSARRGRPAGSAGFAGGGRRAAGSAPPRALARDGRGRVPPLVGSQIPSGATVRRPPPAPGTRRADLVPSRPARSRGNVPGAGERPAAGTRSRCAESRPRAAAPTLAHRRRSRRLLLRAGTSRQERARSRLGAHAQWDTSSSTERSSRRSSRRR